MQRQIFVLIFQCFNSFSNTFCNNRHGQQQDIQGLRGQNFFHEFDTLSNAWRQKEVYRKAWHFYWGQNRIHSKPIWDLGKTLVRFNGVLSTNLQGRHLFLLNRKPWTLYSWKTFKAFKVWRSSQGNLGQYLQNKASVVLKQRPDPDKSQRDSHHPWAIANKNGKILTVTAKLSKSSLISVLIY